MTSQVNPTTRPWMPPFDLSEYVLPEERRIAAGPRARFGDMPRWDLSAGGLAPNLNAAQAHLRFDDLPASWVSMAKTLAMAMLNPTHPIVRSAGVFRSNQPYKMKSINHALSELRYLARWATEADHATDLSQWSDEVLNNYLENVQATRAVSASRSATDLLRHLVGFGALMEGGGLRLQIGSSEGTGTAGAIKTPVIPPGHFLATGSRMLGLRRRLRARHHRCPRRTRITRQCTDRGNTAEHRVSKRGDRFVAVLSRRVHSSASVFRRSRPRRRDQSGWPGVRHVAADP